MPVVFPPELLDAITAQLDPIRDVKTIRACAMTFRDWNDVARPYIFRQVGIKNESDLRNFASIVDDAPGIGQVVQELVLRGTPHCTSTRWINLVGEDLPQRLPKVHTLTWLCLRLDQPCCPSLRSTLATFKAVTRFNLWQCTSPFQWLQTYITPLPSLRHLTIEDQTSHTKRPLQTQSGLVPELASLIIRDMHQVVLLMDWLLNSHSWEKSLRHLAVPATYMATPYLGQILQRSGSHLEHLDLDLCFSEYDNDLWLPELSEHLDLRPNTGLKALTLRFFKATELARGLLAQVSSPDLKVLRFFITNFNETSRPSYLALAQNLSGGLYANLEEFEILSDDEPNMWAH